MARVVGTLDSTDVLCEYCSKDFASCPKPAHIAFGNGVGNDNVTECSEFIVKSIHDKYPIIGKPELGVFRGCCRDA